MNRFSAVIIRRKGTVIILFVILAIICAILYTKVRVNFNMVDYLPPEAPSTKALEMMSYEFDRAMPNANVIINNVTIPEAILLKAMMLELDYVVEVQWLDDAVDIMQPLEMGDRSLIENYYQNNSARYFVVVEKANEKEGIAILRDFIGVRGTITGEAADIEFLQTAADSEVFKAVLIVVPIVLVILVLSTTSWIEPLLFLITIGISVAINMGTSAFLNEVSFLTNSVTPILQLAVSLDYAIFLLHSFSEHRKTGMNIDDAMSLAIKESFATIAASASTTLFGFMALLVMDFRIGADLGLSLAKGIAISFITVIVFLPALTISIYKTIDKTQHRELLPSFRNIHNILRWIAIPVTIILAIIIVPCFLGQSRTDFLYSYQVLESEEGEGGGLVWDTSPVMAILVPKGDAVREELLSDELEVYPFVTSVVSYAKTIGAGIPPELLDSSITQQFYSESYARILVYLNTPKEGELAFQAVDLINETANKYYPNDVYSAGQSANLYDIKTVVQNDNRLTSMIAIIAIFLVLLVSFKSASLPFILLFTIQAAIWINLSIPYFTGISINYVGYLVLNTVQLGATVDYAILLTMTYMRERKSLSKKESIYKAIGSSFHSILVSATTMASAGFTLALTSTNPIISDIGMLLGRGTLLSMLMVVVFLPAALTTLDKIIIKSTIKSK